MSGGRILEICYANIAISGEATVHVTNVTSEKILGKSHFCAACAPSVEQMKHAAIKQLLKSDSPGTTSGKKPPDAT
jgi:hypothetical protein